MPRSFSMLIQSDVAAAPPMRPDTEPASRMAPLYSSSFSVRVVLPASGCEMMANVRRRATSCDKRVAPVAPAAGVLGAEEPGEASRMRR